MSSLKSAARRIAMFASSSLGAAGFVVLATSGAAIVPTTALAQTVTCAPPPTSGNGTSTATYAGGTTTAGVTYNPGILCNFTGQDATVSTTGNITVSTSGGMPADPLVNGVNLRATGSNEINWNSTAGRVTGGSQTNGPVIDARTVDGDIAISTGIIGAGNATVTHGIYAQSTGAGDIGISLSGFVQATNNTSGFAGIEAIADGGDISISTSSNTIVQGRLYGIRAVTSDSGSVAINAAQIDASTTASGGAALSVTMGTGALLLQAPTIRGLGSSALRIDTQGDFDIELASVSSDGTAPTVDLITAAGRETAITHTGSLTANTPSEIVYRVVGGSNLSIDTLSDIVGRLDLGAHTGSLEFSVDRRWATNGASTFGAGDSTLVISPTADWLVGLLALQDASGSSGPSRLSVDTAVIDFGAGDDTVTNNGVMMLAPKSVALFGRYALQEYLESETRLVGLETFENTGAIYFGGSALPGGAAPVIGDPTLGLKPGSYATGPDYAETDYVNDDVLSMPGTHWKASGDSLLVMDVLMSNDQSACDVSLRNTEILVEAGGSQISGEMPAADCLGLQGGSTEGVTNILINQLGGISRGGPIRIVLVDVEGGESDVGHFVLDPRNHGYSAEYGGFLDVGYFIFPLVYDAEAQQHVLLGTAGPNAWQTATWATAAHDLWRTSTGTWFDRQADLRGNLPEGVGGGIWLRTSTDFVDRTVTQEQLAGAVTLAFDNSYRQDSYAVTGGADLLVGGGANSAWVVGLMAGYANSDMAYTASPNTMQLDSWNGGLYASYLMGGLYVDAAVSATKGDVEADMPALNLFPTGTRLSTPFLSVGAQVEGGWRFPLSSGLFIEPLAGASWVRTTWDELTIPTPDPLRQGVDVDFGDPASLRANAGARFGLDQDYGGLRAQYSLLGRVWNEFEGEHLLTLDNVADDVTVGDELTGQFSEFGVGVSVYGLGEALSAFVNFGGKFGDDYSSQNATIGVRVNW